jgi:hypothetical protein
VLSPIACPRGNVLYVRAANPAVFPPGLTGALRSFAYAIKFAALMILVVVAQTVINGQSLSTPYTYSPGANPNYAVAADFDGDGKIDLADADVGWGTITFAFNDGAGSFSSRIAYPTEPNSGSSHPEPLAVGDFNGDGKPDLAEATSNQHRKADPTDFLQLTL